MIEIYYVNLFVRWYPMGGVKEFQTAFSTIVDHGNVSVVTYREVRRGERCLCKKYNRDWESKP